MKKIILLIMLASFSSTNASANNSSVTMKISDPCEKNGNSLFCKKNRAKLEKALKKTIGDRIKEVIDVNSKIGSH